MDLEKIMRKIYQKCDKKYVRYTAEEGKKCCKTCLLCDGRIYAADDPEKPVLPRHINCRCHYEEYHDDHAEEKVLLLAEIAKYAIVETQGPTALVMLDTTQIAAEIATNFSHWVWIAKSMARVADDDFFESYMEINDYNTKRDVKGLAGFISRKYQEIFRK